MADLNQLLRFPQEINPTSVRPNLVLWSSLTKTVIMVELTIPWEDRMETAFKRKEAKYGVGGELLYSQWRSGAEATH